jgi:hypothetical protein
MVSAHSGNDTMLFDKGYYLQGAYLFNLDPGDERRAASTMSQQENVRAMFTSSDISRLPVRERVGLAIQAADFITAITRIREA